MPPTASGVGSVELGSLKVEVDESLALTAAIADDPAPTSGQLAQLATDLGGQPSTPVELSSADPLPPTGAVLSRTYPAPLPANTAATFAYYDTQTSRWTAVPSTLSDDRRVLSATVSHFSIWDDISYSIGTFLGERVDGPTCSPYLPSWIKDSSSIIYTDDQNGALRWCAGKDNNDLLQIKVRVNRGYGMVIRSTIPAEATFNSFLQKNGVEYTKLLTDTENQAINYSTATANLLNGSPQELPGQEEAIYTFTEEQVRSAPDGGVGLVYADKPSLAEVSTGIAMGLLKSEIPSDNPAVYVTEFLDLVHCEQGIYDSSDNWTSEMGTFVNCVRDSAGFVKDQAVGFLKQQKNYSKEFETKVGAVVDRWLAILDLGYIASQMGTYFTDLATGQASYEISVYPKPVAPAIAPVTDSLLLTAPVPALRGNHAGNLVAGVLPDTGNGTVGLVQTGGGAPAHGDLTGDGVADVAAAIDATSGAGGLDEYVELYTNGNQRFAEWDPAAATNADHAFLSAMLIRGGDVLVDGSAEHLPNGPETYWSARLHWTGQELKADVQLGNTGITRSGLWSDTQLTITPVSLGAVKIGMTLAEVNAAAGVNVDMSGDGVYDSTQMPTGSLQLYVHGETVSCVGAGSRPSSTQRVVTQDGVAVGDPVSKVLSTYPQATFVPPPTDGGRTTNSGYVVSTTDGDLAFVLDSANTTIIEIAGGPGVTPNSCAG